jgi:hypothetical protein
MTIASYTDLVQRCQDWLFGRADIAPRVPDFITMFEAKANRKLLCRQMEVRAYATVDVLSIEPEFLSLPSDFQTMRRVRLLVPSGAPPSNTGPVFGGKPRLKFATGAQMDDLRQKNVTPGQPVWFTVFNTEIELYPVPNAAYQVEMVYRTYLPPLGTVNATNWLLTIAPDAYLYGTLMEAAPYLADDDRIQVWASGVASAFQDLNELSDEATFNAGPLVIRRKAGGYS